MAVQHPFVDAQIAARLKMLPRYRVVLHNDDTNDMANDMDRVVRALLYIVMPLSVNDAIAVMLRAQTYGSAHIITCPRETAEFYADGLAGFGLMTSIEPA
jgi:ATP-dependent Clp protease adaptor protein ClpS